jgi:hypothetical protein
LGKDRRPSHVDVQRFSTSQTASGACLGKTTPLRTLSLKPLTDLSEIWKEAELRLKTDRSNFSLVFNGSGYLPTSGFLPKPTQLFEIRWQGRGGKPKTIVKRKVSIYWSVCHSVLAYWAETVEKTVREWAREQGFRWSPQNWISGGAVVSQKFERPTGITVKEFFEGIDNRNWGFIIEGHSFLDNQNLPPEEIVKTPEEEEILEESSEELGLVDTGDLPWIDPKDRGIITTPHYDNPAFAADVTDGADFSPRPKERAFKLMVSINGGSLFTRKAYDRETILQSLAIQGEVLDEKTSIAGGKDTRTENQLRIAFQEYFKGIPYAQRTLFISNPTEIGWVRRRP